MTSGDGHLTMPSRRDQLRAMLADAQEQLLARDDAIRSLRSEEFAERNDVIARQGEEIRWLGDLLAHRDGEADWLRSVVGDKERESNWLRERIEEQEQSLHAVQSTKLWRLGQRYWGLRDRLRGRPKPAR